MVFVATGGYHNLGTQDSINARGRDEGVQVLQNCSAGRINEGNTLSCS